MDQKQFEAMLADAEIRLRRLRTLYDQWFHGLERTEPRTQRREIDKIIVALRGSPPRNTALRFRFHQLVQRYTTYNTYWQRITRQIEEGTYKRDVLRAKRRYTDEQSERPPSNEHDLDLDIDIEAALEAATKSEPPGAVAPSTTGSGSTRPPSRPPSKPPPTSDRPLRAQREITPFAMPTARPVTALGPRPSLQAPPAAVSRKPLPVPAGASRIPPPIPAGASRRPPPPPSAQSNGPNTGVSDAQIQGIYQRYVDARRENRERTDNVKLETVAKTVRDMMPKLSQKHAGKQIDFEVVVKDGRVALKPVAK